MLIEDYLKLDSSKNLFISSVNGAISAFNNVVFTFQREQNGFRPVYLYYSSVEISYLFDFPDVKSIIIRLPKYWYGAFNIKHGFNKKKGLKLEFHNFVLCFDYSFFPIEQFVNRAFQQQPIFHEGQAISYIDITGPDIIQNSTFFIRKSDKQYAYMYQNNDLRNEINNRLPLNKDAFPEIDYAFVPPITIEQYCNVSGVEKNNPHMMDYLTRESTKIIKEFISQKAIDSLLDSSKIIGGRIEIYHR